MIFIRRAVLRTRYFSTHRSGGTRAYEPGEEARAIDWRASARRGSLQIRERSAHVALAWGTIVDGSLSMTAGCGRSLAESAREAAGFWRDCGASGDRWIDVDPGVYGGLVRGLDRALHFLPAHSALLVMSDFFDLPQVCEALLRAAAQRLDCTALVARDPWRDGLPLAGFVAVADLETGDVRRFFICPRARMQFQRKAAARELAVLARLHQAGWRVATFSEDDGAQAVLRAFGAP